MRNLQKAPRNFEIAHVQFANFWCKLDLNVYQPLIYPNPWSLVLIRTVPRPWYVLPICRPKIRESIVLASYMNICGKYMSYMLWYMSRICQHIWAVSHICLNIWQLICELCGHICTYMSYMCLLSWPYMCRPSHMLTCMSTCEFCWCIAYVCSQ